MWNRDAYVNESVTFDAAYAHQAGANYHYHANTPALRHLLADHVDFALAMLHGHHESEDELLYPLLIERVPEQAARTEQVEHEHRMVSDALDRAGSACRTWRSAPSDESGEALAASLDDLLATLQPHLDDEETDVVPLAARTLTQAEWDAMGAHSRAKIPRDRMPIAFGMLLEPLDEDDRAHMRSQLPGPVRLLYPLLIQRPWDRYKEQLRHGT